MLRTALLDALKAVSPGVGKDEQGYVWFGEDEIASSNGETSCRIVCDVGLTATVLYEPLVKLLTKLDDEEIKLSLKDGQLIVKAGKRRAGIRCELERHVEIQRSPSSWFPIPERFVAAIDAASRVVSENESHFEICCLHLTSDWIEGFDNFQWLRWSIKTGLTRPVLIRGGKQLAKAEPTEIAEDDSWLHFRAGSGLVLSCRKYALNYPDLNHLAAGNAQVECIVLPKSLLNAVEKAEIFSEHTGCGIEANRVYVDLAPERIILEGRGQTGWYQEVFTNCETGPCLKFAIDPDLLRHIVASSCPCTLLGNEGGQRSRMLIQAEEFTLVCVLYLS